MNSDTDTDTESEITDREIEPSSKKPRIKKFSGAHSYKMKFSAEWKKTWPFISAVPGNPHSFRCNVCAKNLSCAHQGKSDIN